MKKLIDLTKEELVKKLWDADPRIFKMLRDSKHVEEARHLLFDYFNYLDRSLFNMKPDTFFAKMNIVEKRNAKECIRVFSNTIRTENEYLTKASPLQLLCDLAQEKPGGTEHVTEAFLCEYIAFFYGITGKAGKHLKSQDLFSMKDGRQAAIIRSQQLDEYAALIRKYLRRYKTGLQRSVIREREVLKKEITEYFGGKEEDWQDYLWHYKHIIKDIDTLSSLVHLEDDELEGLKCAKLHGIPFEITPYYLSLFHKEGRTDYDRQIRAQVIPSVRYCIGCRREQKKRD